MKIFKLKDISEFIRNGVTIKQDISSKEGIPITRIETISKGTIDFNKLGYANIFEIEKYKEWLLKKGDILISHINSEKHLGKSAIYLDNNYDIIHGMNLLCIRVIDKKVFPEYLQLFFKTNQYKKQIKKITKKSVNQASFSVNDFKEILITLPELNIQEKIIKKIKVLEKILENNKLKLDYLSELAKSLFTRMFGDIRTNSKNWEINYWKDVLNIKNGKNQKQVEDKNGKYPIYGSGGIIGYSNAYICNENTIIIGRKGNINKPILVKEKFWNVDTAFGLETKRDKISYYYLYYFCLFYNFEIHNKAVTIPSLIKSDLEKILLPVPPIELQNKFAERVEKIEKLSFEIKKSIKEAENLYNSLINKYFE